MKKLLVPAFLAIPFLFAAPAQTQAQMPAHPHFAPFGCGGYCLGFLSRLHFHGPLVNYGPYSGYYPFEPYGPWTSDLRYNAPQPSCGSCGSGHCRGGSCRTGWGHYSICTLKNVFNRCNPLANRCGSSLKLGNCGTPACGTPAVAASAEACPPASVSAAVQAPAAVEACPAVVAPAAPVATYTPVPQPVLSEPSVIPQPVISNPTPAVTPQVMPMPMPKVIPIVAPVPQNTEKPGTAVEPKK